MAYKDHQKHLEACRKNYILHPYRYAARDARRRAKEKGLEYNLDEEYLEKIWPKNNKCPILGIKFKRGEGKPIDSSPNLDRIIPEKGYIKGNMQMICQLANRIKTTATPDQVLKVGYYLKKTVDKTSLESIIDILKTIDGRTNSMIVRGKAQWAHVFEPNELSGKYQVDICNLDAKTVKELEAVGIDVKTGEGDKAEKGRFIIAKSAKYPPKVVDRRGDVMDETVLIGNGSQIKASIRPYEWNFKGKAGVGAGLNSLMVTSLVEYGGLDDLDPEDDGEDNDEL